MTKTNTTAATVETAAKRGRPRQFARIPLDTALAAMAALAKAGKSVAKINPKGAAKNFAFAAMIAEAVGDDASFAEFTAFVEGVNATVEAEAAKKVGDTVGIPVTVPPMPEVAATV